MTGGEAISGIRMEHSRIRKPPSTQSEDTRPGDRAFLTSAAECMPPMPKQPIPEHRQAMKVSWYRIVAESEVPLYLRRPVSKAMQMDLSATSRRIRQLAVAPPR